jgi:hypothetical protein
MRLIAFRHRRALAISGLCVGLGVSVAAPAVADTGVAGYIPRFTASLSGAAEIDPTTGASGVGDPDGTASIRIKLRDGLGQVCFARLATDGVATPPLKLHLHQGTAGTIGPVVVDFTDIATQGQTSGCVAVDLPLIRAIRADASQFYVNFHSTEFPDGAVRGQLVDNLGGTS